MTQLRLSLALALLVFGLVAGIVFYRSAGDRSAEPGFESAPSGASGTVLVVRHAEKRTDVDDPPLSEVGRERAAALARMVGGLDVDGLVSTPYRRSVETLEPVAEATGVRITLVPVEGGDIDVHCAAVAEACRGLLQGGTVVVAGHSNTVPGIVRALGAGSVPELGEDDYEDIFVVRLDEAGGATVLPLRYGL